MSAKLPILVYHSIDELGTAISTSREVFAAQMARLAKGGWKSMTLEEAAGRVSQGQTIPPKSVAISFDDGMVSVRDTADPILQEYGFRATLFVITGQVGKKPGWYRLPEPYRREPLLSIDALAELRDRGWDLQPHTHDHPVLSHLPADLQAEQINLSRDLIRRWFGARGSVLAYPFGQHDENTRRAMAAAGLVAGVTLRFSVWIDPGSMYEWPRIGSAWLKKSPIRQSLALHGVLEKYVNFRSRFRGDRSRHFMKPDEETTRGLLRSASDGHAPSGSNPL